MFIKYIFNNLSTFFTLWLILTMVNQVLFFGACLRPDCILASIPHVSAITAVFMYVKFKDLLTTFDALSGYNEFGYHKNGFDRDGYDINGFDREGYNIYGVDKNGLDRKSQGEIARFFTSRESKEELKKLNDQAREENKAFQRSLTSKKYKPTIESLKTEEEKSKMRREELLAKSKARISKLDIDLERLQRELDKL